MPLSRPVNTHSWVTQLGTAKFHLRHGLSSGLTGIAGLDNDGLDIDGVDNDGRIWAIDCNQLKITIERFYQLTGTYV